MDARTNEKELLSPEIIFNAVAGEEQAIREVLEFYEKQIYIKFQCIARKQGINISHMPLEDMKQEVQLDLCKAIRKFNT